MILILLLFSYSAWSHPVSYKNSFTMETHNRNDMSFNSIHFSPEAKYSFGVKHFRDEKINFQGLYSGLLLYRYNGDSSQANVYTYGAIGNGNHYGWQADYETRKFYTLYSYNKVDQKISMSNHKMRLGYSPFKAGYDDIHLWTILEYNSDQDSISPLLRFFYKNILWETGYTPRNKGVIFNIILNIFSEV